MEDRKHNRRRSWGPGSTTAFLGPPSKAVTSKCLLSLSRLGSLRSPFSRAGDRQHLEHRVPHGHILLPAGAPERVVFSHENALLLGPGNGRIEQLVVEHDEVAQGHGDEDGPVLAPLGLVDGEGIGEPEELPRLVERIGGDGPVGARRAACIRGDFRCRRKPDYDKTMTKMLKNRRFLLRTISRLIRDRSRNINV